MKFGEAAEVFGRDLFELITFGSSYLKTDGPVSDIDSILCTYADITIIEDGIHRKIPIMDHENGSFFDEFFRYLGEIESIKNLIKVEEAHVPLIKMTLLDVDIDLLLCSKKQFAQDLCDMRDIENKKSFISIQGRECSIVLEKIAKSLKIPAMD